MIRDGTSDSDKVMRLARGLGWFSLGLGLAEVLLPGLVAGLAGVPKRKKLIRLLGFREVASGLAIFTQRRPAGALWSRVAGDAMDLALLSGSLLSSRSDGGRVLGAIATVGGVTALDVFASRQVSANPEAKHKPTHIEESITINRSPEDLYAFWHDFENLPRFMEHVRAVERTGENRWHWVAKGPGGLDVDWDAEIINEHPNEMIAWRSLVGSQIDTAGSVRFVRAPANRGTIVRVNLEYSPPGKALGSTLASLLGEAPEKQVPSDLRRFKQLMELGDIIRTEGQPAGRSRSTSLKFDELVRK